MEICVRSMDFDNFPSTCWEVMIRHLDVRIGDSGAQNFVKILTVSKIFYAHKRELLRSAHLSGSPAYAYFKRGGSHTFGACHNIFLGSYMFHTGGSLDLNPLFGIPNVVIAKHGLPVDLTPLSHAHYVRIFESYTVFDLSCVTHFSKLKCIMLPHCRIVDISGLRGIKAVCLKLCTEVVDFSPLSECEAVDISATLCSDLSPFVNVTFLSVHMCRNLSLEDIECVRHVKHLTIPNGEHFVEGVSRSSSTRNCVCSQYWRMSDLP